MSFDGGRWRATMGDFDTAGQAYFWVEAIDAEGNRAVADDQVLDVRARLPAVDRAQAGPGSGRHSGCGFLA